LEKKYNGSQLGPSIAWLPTFFKISTEERDHTGLEQLEGE